jgi:deoxycytidylate deaminase
MMGMAYVEATRSRCLKRQVGAVIVDADDEVVSMGLNENPPGKASCYSRKNCEKDSRMRGELDSKIGSPCPTCSSPLVLQQPAYVCANCGHSIKEMLFPDRGMRWCTAMHAEDTAIRLAGSRKLGDCTLYSTTFPCLNCAKAVAYSGIRKITYVEPYPDADSAAFLKEVGINVELFEGVKARAFHRLFWPTRAEMEARYNMGV